MCHTVCFSLRDRRFAGSSLAMGVVLSACMLARVKCMPDHVVYCAHLSTFCCSFDIVYTVLQAGNARLRGRRCSGA